MPEIFNGTFAKWMLGLCTAAIVAAAGALWTLSSHLATLEERVAAWTRLYEEKFMGLQHQDIGLQDQISVFSERQRQNEEKINRNSVRLDNLERR